MKKPLLIIIIMILAAALAAKGTKDKVKQKKEPVKIKVTSPDFKPGKYIPRIFTCKGTNISPGISWSGIPKKTRSIILIADDPDAPAGTWVHWVVYNIPANTKGLPKDIKPQKKFRNGMMQGINSWKKTGYGGPCPPSGTHRYYFKVYAADKLLDIPPGKADKAAVLKAIKGHILAEGYLMGKYKK